jgi:hypothetical protein
MVPAEPRPSAYGLFKAAYGVSWFLGSALIGFLYDISITAVIAFSVAAELAAMPFFLKAAHAIPRRVCDTKVESREKLKESRKILAHPYFRPLGQPRRAREDPLTGR